MSNLSPQQFDGIVGANTEGIATAYNLGLVSNRLKGVVSSRKAPGGKPLMQGGAQLKGTTGVRQPQKGDLISTLRHHYGIDARASNN